MSKPAIHVLKYLLPALAATLVFYLVALAPRYEAIATSEKAVQDLQEDIARTRSALGRMAPIAAREEELWDMMDMDVAAGLFDETNLTGALAELSDSVYRAGATLMTVTLDSAPATGGATGGGRPSPVRKATSSPALPDGLRAAVTFHPVTLRVKGPYASWSKLLAEMSREAVPVLLDRAEGHPWPGAPCMTMSLTVPALRNAQGARAEAREAEGAWPSGFTQELAALYRLDRLRQPVIRLLEPSQTEPFPAISEEDAPGPLPALVVSAIVERNGVYVAVVNKQVLAVGDEIEGRRIVRITPRAVILR